MMRIYITQHIKTVYIYFRTNCQARKLVGVSEFPFYSQSIFKRVDPPDRPLRLTCHLPLILELELVGNRRHATNPIENADDQRPNRATTIGIHRPKFDNENDWDTAEDGLEEALTSAAV